MHFPPNVLLPMALREMTFNKDFGTSMEALFISPVPYFKQSNRQRLHSALRLQRGSKETFGLILVAEAVYAQCSPHVLSYFDSLENNREELHF